MPFLAFFEQLGETEWSVALHESQYAYSIIESLHVWTLCLFFGMTVMFDLRLLGWTMRKVPVSEVIRRLQPLTIAAFVVMVITGTLLVYAIPPVVSEHFLQDENASAAARRPQHPDLPLAHFPQGR